MSRLSTFNPSSRVTGFFLSFRFHMQKCSPEITAHWETYKKELLMDPCQTATAVITTQLNYRYVRQRKEFKERIRDREALGSMSIFGVLNHRTGERTGAMVVRLLKQTAWQRRGWNKLETDQRSRECMIPGRWEATFLPSMEWQS